MTEESLADPASLIARARTSRLEGRPGEAWRLLGLAKQNCDVRAFPEILMIEAELLLGGGRVEAAEDRLLQLLDQVPDHFWAAFHLAAGAWRRKEYALAQSRIATARALDPDGRIGALWRLRINVMQDLGQAKRADHLLNQMARAFENDPWPRQQMAFRSRKAGKFDLALGHCRAAMRLDPDDQAHALLHAQLLAQMGEKQQAVSAYAIMEAAHGPDPELALARIQLLRSIPNRAQEIEALTDALGAHPNAASLWQHLFSAHLSVAPVDTAGAILELLKNRLAPQAHTLLSIRYCLEMNEYQNAHALCRTLGPRTTNPVRAFERAQTLWGGQKYSTALRYVRFCVRRWPASTMLFKTFIAWGMKLGQGEMVAEVIAPHLHLHSETATLESRLLLAGFFNSLGDAVVCYKSLRALGQEKPHHRELISKMIITLARFDDIPSILSDIGDPLSESGKLRHRAGVPGNLMLEYDIERSNGTVAHADPIVWARERPESTLAAIRVIDQWRRDSAPSDATGSKSGTDAEIPKRLFQYWHKPNPPATIKAMVACWATKPGYSHELLDQHTAARFLKHEFGADWFRAFQLAANPSEQADLLRLCALARHGGVYADVDDALYADLDKILANRSGLILYRESMGGTIGNNFIASAADQPVMVKAAEAARDALLERSVELSWSKTGPGLLTRVLAQAILEHSSGASLGTIHIVEQSTIAQSVVMHNQNAQKSGHRHWAKNSGKDDEGTALWEHAFHVLTRTQ